MGERTETEIVWPSYGTEGRLINFGLDNMLINMIFAPNN